MRAYVVEAAEGLYAEGSTFADNPIIAAAANSRLGDGYETVHQCSGLIRQAYKAADMCLDFDYGPDGSWAPCWNPPSIAKQAGVVEGANGIKIFYDTANVFNQNKSVRLTNDPLIGDIVFFSNTSGPGHPFNHGGIAVSGPDADGTVIFIHAASKGVQKSRMNILKILPNPVSGDFLGSFCAKGQGIPDCLAGSLFVGYGTIRDPRTLKK